MCVRVRSPVSRGPSGAWLGRRRTVGLRFSNGSLIGAWLDEQRHDEHAKEFKVYIGDSLAKGLEKGYLKFMMNFVAKGLAKEVFSTKAHHSNQGKGWGKVREDVVAELIISLCLC